MDLFLRPWKFESFDPSTVLKLSMLKVSLKQQQTTKKLSKTLKIDPNFVIRLLIKM